MPQMFPLLILILMFVTGFILMLSVVRLFWFTKDLFSDSKLFSSSVKTSNFSQLW